MLIAIMLVAAGARVVAALVLPDQSDALSDISMYRGAAGNLIQNGVTGTPFVMPLYPLLIAATGTGIGQLVANIALSLVSVWLVYRIAIDIFGDPRIGLFAAAIAALYPPLVFFAVVGLSETLFLALVLASFHLWYRGRFFGAAFFAILAILTRPIFDFIAPLLVVVFALAVHRQSAWRVARHLAVYAVLYVALMAPWWWHNVRAYDQFVRLNPGGGFVLYAGNNPMNMSGGGNLGVDYELSRFAHLSNDAEKSNAMRATALDHIRDDPVRFMRMAALKFWRMWRPWPQHEAYTSRFVILIAGLTFLPLLALCLLSPFFWSGREAMRAIPVILFAFALTAAHMVLLGTIRYRLPVEPFIAILAAVPLVRGYDRVALRATDAGHADRINA